MSKFEAGDRVVVVRNNHDGYENYLGNRGEVTSIGSEAEYEVRVLMDEGYTRQFDSSELEFEHVYDELSAKPAEQSSSSPAVKVDSRDSGFVTKDSGARETYASGMVRDADGATKDNFFLMVQQGVPYEEQFLTRFAQLLTRGAQKYSKRNFELANSPAELERAQESLFRHLMQYLCGDKTEDHAMAIVFNVMLAELVQFRMKSGGGK
jgi:hypothetical protein